MKIDSTLKSIGPGTVSAGSTRSSKGAPSKPSSGGGESVQLSPLSSQMQAIEASMAETPVVDSARVAEIKQAIADGRFKVNPHAVADSLLQTAHDLIQSKLA
ncbi:MAG TPA: flagellar biosynthesis anti-sigma factor FlgM [Burkholderiales bacterium]|nr:flagellar biosynthesis anti-sigma factor FlgM [Burkholderiales bacterium]